MTNIYNQKIDKSHYEILKKCLDNINKEIKIIDNTYKFTDLINNELSDQLIRLNKTNDFLKQQCNELQEILNIKNIIEIDYTNTSPIYISIKNNNFSASVSSWKDSIEEVCKFVASKDKYKFKKMSTDLVGKKRLYFSNNQYNLKSARYIEDMNIFVETNFSAIASVKFIKKILAYYNIDENNLEIVLKNK